MQIAAAGTHDNSVAPTRTAAAPAHEAAQHRQVAQAVKALNSAALFGQENQLNFARDPATKRMVVQVVDRSTNQVISQIPAEYLLRLAQSDETSQSKPSQPIRDM